MTIWFSTKCSLVFYIVSSLLRLISEWALVSSKDQVNRKLRPCIPHQMKWRQHIAHIAFFLSRICFTFHVEDVSDWVRDYSVAFLLDAVKKTHRVCLSSSCVTIHKNQAVITRMLLKSFQKHIVDDIFTAHLEHFLPIFLAIEDIIKMVNLIFECCFYLDRMLAQIFHLLILLLFGTRLKFDENLNNLHFTLSLS
jgi:hypothetical protein